ncbi:MAG: PQQ-dependent sugar dehydrogenase [Bdellovibrionota bacterium]
MKKNFSLLLRAVALTVIILTNVRSSFADGIDVRDVSVFPAHGFFNGFLGQLNVLECSNRHTADATLNGQLYDSSGASRASFALSLPAGSTKHLILNELDIANRYGSFVLSLSGDAAAFGDRIKCFTAYYRLSSSHSTSAVEFAYMLPVKKLSSGTVSGVANSMNPDGRSAPTENWLSVYNGSAANEGFNVILYDVGGNQLRSFRIESLLPHERRDIPLAHDDVSHSGQTIYGFRLVPDSLTAPFAAFTTRYGTSDTGFKFAFAAFSEEGDCRTRPLPVSTVSNAASYVELLNSAGSSTTVDVTLRNEAGQVLSSNSVVLPANAQDHLAIHNVLPANQAGTIEVSCRDPQAGSIVRNVVTYGKRSGSTAWAYLTPAREPYGEAGAELVFPVNTYLQAYNWLKVYEASASATSFVLGARGADGSDIFSRTESLSALTQKSYAIHEQVPADRIGTLSVSPQISGSLAFAENLRVFPASDGSPGYVMHVPSSVLIRTPSGTPSFTTVATGIVQPVTVAFAPDSSGRMFVSTKLGYVYIVQNGVTRSTPFIDLTATTSTETERGLSNIEFHPQFATNGKFYVGRTDLSHASVIEEYRVSNSDPNQADPSTRRLILSIPRNGDFHISNIMHFAPDGTLFISEGDGGPQGDPENHSQNPGLLLGKLLRIDVDHGATYTVPTDNPFFGSSEFRPEIWAYGLRNPYSYTFDIRSNRMFLGDVGYNDREEVDIIEPGKNYGWNIYEGTRCTNLVNTCSTTGLVAPIFDYGHDVGISILGGGIYRGSAVPALYGKYIYIDYGSKRIYTLEEIAQDTWRNTEIGRLTQAGLPTAINNDRSGELYITDIYGKVFKLTGLS